MPAPSPEDIALLRQAKTKAEKLLADLLRQDLDLKQSPPKIDPEKLAQGQLAFANAIASARNMLDNIEQALQLVDNPSVRGD